MVKGRTARGLLVSALFDVKMYATQSTAAPRTVLARDVWRVSSAGVDAAAAAARGRPGRKHMFGQTKQQQPAQC